MSSMKKTFSEAVKPKTRNSNLAPNSSPIEVTQDMSTILQSMILVANKTTDSIPSLKEDHLQKEALHDNRFHDSQQTQQLFLDSQKSVQNMMSDMMENLDDMHHHIEAVENRYPPIESNSKTFSSVALASPSQIS